MNPRHAVVVLIVDDDSLDTYLLHHSLLNCGVINATSMTGLQAAEFVEGLGEVPFATVLPDIIFLDLKLREIGGLELIARIKENPLLRNSTVIVLSGPTHPCEQEKAIELGATFCFEKKSGQQEIQTIIEEALNLCVV